MGLFNKKQEEKKPVAPPAPSGKKEATYFGKNLKITGNVSGNGDIIILGKLEGEFNLKGALQVAEPASVTGEIKANNITVKGSVEGTITIKGHINSPKISVTDGALFDGEINMTSQATKPLYSPISDSSTPPKHAEDTEKK
jgi:cytoskeletal protein CcmA (bactofilin family)